MDFTQENIVSVWLGAAVPESDFVALLSPREDAAPDAGIPPSRFAEDFGIAWYDHDFLEAAYEEDNRPIAALLDGVSYGESFAEAVGQLALQAGIPEANAAVLLYDVAYVFDPEVAKPGSALRFLGAFPYEPDGDGSAAEN